jgi:hypothetical protein
MYKTVKLAEWLRGLTQAAQNQIPTASAWAGREQRLHYGPDETLWRSVAANTAVPEANKKRI